MRIELTGKCNFQCLYCHAGLKNTAGYQCDEISHQRKIELIREAKQLGVSRFTLTGGEPFLYEQWPEIVEECGSDSQVIFSTNGTCFDEKNIAIIARLPQVSEFRMSLDGLATNDIIREGSSFHKCINVISLLKNKLPDKKIMIQTVIYQQNIPEILPLYQKLKELGVYWWRLSQLWKTVRTEKNKHIVNFSNYEQMFKMYESVIKKFLYDNKPFRLSIDNAYYSWITEEDYLPMDINSHPCAYNFDNICLNANGDLMFCPAIGETFGSAKNFSLGEVLAHSEWLNSFKKIKVADFGCNSCRYLKICGGGCRADSLRWLGKKEFIDPNSCCMMPYVEKVIIPLLKGEEQAAYKKLLIIKGDYPEIGGNNIEEAIINRKGGD